MTLDHQVQLDTARDLQLLRMAVRDFCQFLQLVSSCPPETQEDRDAATKRMQMYIARLHQLTMGEHDVITIGATEGDGDNPGSEGNDNLDDDVGGQAEDSVGPPVEGSRAVAGD